jgi:hypothetical protein
MSVAYCSSSRKEFRILLIRSFNLFLFFSNSLGFEQALRMTAPTSQQQAITAAELQQLRGRVLQLESELIAATKATSTKMFVGTAEAWHSYVGGVDSPQPSIPNALPTARNKAELEYSKWKAANPTAIIAQEECTCHGTTPVQVGQYLTMAPSVTIQIRYRTP